MKFAAKIYPTAQVYFDEVIMSSWVHQEQPLGGFILYAHTCNLLQTRHFNLPTTLGG